MMTTTETTKKLGMTAARFIALALSADKVADLDPNMSAVSIATMLDLAAMGLIKRVPAWTTRVSKRHIEWEPTEAGRAAIAKYASKYAEKLATFKATYR